MDNAHAVHAYIIVCNSASMYMYIILLCCEVYSTHAILLQKFGIRNYYTKRASN